MLLLLLVRSQRGCRLLVVVVNAASLSRASTNFSCVLFISAVNCAFVLARRAIVARLAAVAVARFAIAAMVSSSYAGCDGTAFAMPY